MLENSDRYDFVDYFFPNKFIRKNGPLQTRPGSQYLRISRNRFELLCQLCYLAANTLGIIFMLKQSGIDLVSLSTILGVFTCFYAYSIRPAIENISSGFMIRLSKRVCSGHVIHCAGVTGRVSSIGMISTLVEDMSHIMATLCKDGQYFSECHIDGVSVQNAGGRSFERTQPFIISPSPITSSSLSGGIGGEHGRKHRFKLVQYKSIPNSMLVNQIITRYAIRSPQTTLSMTGITIDE